MIDTKTILEATRSLKVLYVEDDVDVNAQTRLFLDDFFSSVDVAFDGEEGFKLYQAFEKKHGCYHDLLITDIKMPKCDGITMSKEILKVNPDQKIVVISAYNDANYLHELINTGISYFINKPIEPLLFTNTLYRVAQTINDRKIVEQYYEQIDTLNAELLETVDKLHLQNKKLAQSLRVFETKARNIGKCAPKRKEEESKQEYKQEHKQSDEEKELGIMVTNDLPELEELYEEMDALVVQAMLSKNYSQVPELAQLIDKYGSILSGYYSFYTISSSFKDLGQTMATIPLPEDNEQVENIFLMLESFVFTLKRWMEEWSEKKDVNVNFFDDSLISDTKTIINLWNMSLDNNEGGNDEDLDFFF